MPVDCSLLIKIEYISIYYTPPHLGQVGAAPRVHPAGPELAATESIEIFKPVLDGNDNTIN